MNLSSKTNFLVLYRLLLKETLRESHPAPLVNPRRWIEEGGLFSHFFEFFQGSDLDHVAGGFGFKHHLFTSEGIGAFAGFGSGLVFNHAFCQPRQCEFPCTLFM